MHPFSFASSMIAKTIKKICFFILMVLLVVIISINNNQTGEGAERELIQKIPSVASNSKSQPAGFDQPGAIFKEPRRTVDIEMTSYAPINMTTMKDRLLHRRQRVLDNCREIFTSSEQTKRINSKEFLISEKYKLIWCNIFKAASSSWLHKFIVMAGYTDKDMKKKRMSLVEFARTYAYNRPSVRELDSFLAREDFSSFIIVRNPFERLLSAFRDKIESLKKPFYRPLRCYIQKTYGSQDFKFPDCQPSFSEFVDYVIDEHSNGNALDEHWAPYYKFCSPCQAKFDYVLHFETLDEDEAFLVNAIEGLSSVVKPYKLHSSNTVYSAVTDFYFRQLSRHQMRELYAIYENDFKIFDYDIILTAIHEDTFPEISDWSYDQGDTPIAYDSLRTYLLEQYSPSPTARIAKLFHISQQPLGYQKALLAIRGMNYCSSASWLSSGSELTSCLLGTTPTQTCTPRHPRCQYLAHEGPEDQR
ncbi:carbohydrate sulfotransferase 11-like [Palaemon carinicauda]|uniref:carbohydrate sulfotransferase 11-like n=1 Tax=Palaemon carinicauda TaxID=392227 RepID=UPI0035B694AF